MIPDVDEEGYSKQPDTLLDCILIVRRIISTSDKRLCGILFVFGSNSAKVGFAFHPMGSIK